MGVRLTALPDHLAKWGVRFALHPGWETRSRSSGDFVDVMAIGVHHTASATTPERDLAYNYANSPDRPIGNGLLDRTGLFTLGAVRATNTQGKGGPLLTARGVIPLDAGNTRMFSIEAANNGVGELWPTPMIDAYQLLCAALLDCINSTTPGPPLDVGAVVAHFEWAPGRKFDPAGRSPYAAGGALWRMDPFRGDVFARQLPVEPDPEPDPDPPPPPEDDDMQPPRLYLVRDPRDGAYYVTDTFTGKTYVDNADAGAEGVRLFGWIGWNGSEQPIPIGQHWASFLDTLPTTTSV